MEPPQHGIAGAMVLVGLGVLLATFGFLCWGSSSQWRSWALAQSRTFFDSVAGSRSIVPPKSPTKSTEPVAPDPLDIAEASARRAAENRKAMPPPALLLQKTQQANDSPGRPPTPPQTTSSPASPPDTPLARAADLSIPPSPLDLSAVADPPPLFPAASSAQRASPSSPTPRASLGPPARPVPTPLRNPSAMSPPPPRPTARAPVAAAAAAKPRAKFALAPGHSPLDWAALCARPDADLSGLGLYGALHRVSPEMLRKRDGRRGRAMWMALSGEVYNVGAYRPFHPGGEKELARGAGRDGTALFTKVHPWVNWKGMLKECLVGRLVGEGQGDEDEGVAGTAAQGALDEMD